MSPSSKYTPFLIASKSFNLRAEIFVFIYLIASNTDASVLSPTPNQIQGCKLRAVQRATTNIPEACTKWNIYINHVLTQCRLSRSFRILCRSFNLLSYIAFITSVSYSAIISYYCCLNYYVVGVSIIETGLWD